MQGLTSGQMRRGLQLAVLAAGLVLSGCGSKPTNRPPVEDRYGRGVSDVPPRLLPGYENAGKPGYYTVKRGDTLIGIGLEAGHSYRDIARWNTLENPDKIEVGQVLRVVPPGAQPAASAVAAEPTSGAVAKPVASAVITSSPIAPGQNKPAAPAAVAAPAAASAPAVASAAPATGGDDDLNWMWPVNGPVISGFDESKNKGLDIAGSAGDAVVAAADGRVVYSGAGLRGYGNLIILKHNNTYLTAYAHNRTLLVKEDATVKKGQKIAEMGDSDADRVKLHFEMRKQGKPVDPAKYMPAK